MTYASLEQTLDPEARNNETWRLAFPKGGTPRLCKGDMNCQLVSDL
jgi:hypothetical protein